MRCKLNKNRTAAIIALIILSLLAAFLFMQVDDELPVYDKEVYNEQKG